MQNEVKPLWIGSSVTLREGFTYKLHLVVNDQGELLNVIITAGNIDDRAPVPKLLRGLIPIHNGVHYRDPHRAGISAT
jgi:Transposase DDE domain